MCAPSAGNLGRAGTLTQVSAEDGRTASAGGGVTPMDEQGSASGNRELSPPLPDLLYALAEDGADDETGDRAGPAWAALLQDGPELRRRVLEQLEDDEAAAKDAVDPDDWAALRGAYGVIVVRDNRRNRVTATAFDDEEECLAEWQAIRAGLKGSPPPVESPDPGDSTEGPSSGPVPPHEDRWPP